MLALALLLLAQGGDPVVDAGVEYTGIPHGRLAMDLVRPAGPGPHPVVVLIHGGGFSGGKREDMRPMAEQLARRGFAAASVSYRLTPMYQYPVPLHDVKAAVRFLRANAKKYSLDAEHFAALGVSAGATWAQMLGVTRGMPQFEGNGANREQSSSVACVVSYYGRADLRRSYEGSRNAATALPPLLGGDRDAALARHLQASPLNWVTPDAAPVLAVHGTRDQNVPFEQSVYLVERLRSVGVAAELETIAEAGHGFKGADAERAFTRTVDFLTRHLRPAPPKDARTLLVTDHGPGGQILAVGWPSGRVLWTRPNGKATDSSALPGGGVLFIEDPKGVVTELDAAGKVVWQYKGTGVSLVSASRLANGSTLLVDEATPRLFEVDGSGREVWSVAKPEYKGQAMRRARRSANGTTLVTVQKLGLVLELDATGKTVHEWKFPNRMPAYALPASDGGFWLGLAGPGEVRKFNARGDVEKVFAGPGSATKMAWTSGYVPLADGGMIVSDYQGQRIAEFDAAGKLVHQLTGFSWSVTSISLLN